MKLAIALALVTACSLPKFSGTAGDDDDHPIDGHGSGSGSGHDEDLDGLLDDDDPCPTNPDTSMTVNDDPDGDLIGVGCDPNPSAGDDVRYLYTFADGIGDLQAQGVPDPDIDAINIGNSSTGVRHLFWVPHPFHRVHIELGYHIYSTGIGDAPGVNYEELSIHTTHTGAEGSLEGEGCSVEKIQQVATTHFYVESVNAGQLGTEHDFVDIPNDLTGTDGRLVVDEVGGKLDCVLTTGGNSYHVTQNLGSNTGQVGFSAIQMRAGISYFFVAGQ